MYKHHTQIWANTKLASEHSECILYDYYSSVVCVKHSRLWLWAQQLYPTMFTSHLVIIWRRLWAHFGSGSTEYLHWCGFIFSSDIRRIRSAHFTLWHCRVLLSVIVSGEPWCLSLLCKNILWEVRSSRQAWWKCFLMLYLLPRRCPWMWCVALRHVRLPTSGHVLRTNHELIRCFPNSLVETGFIFSVFISQMLKRLNVCQNSWLCGFGGKKKECQQKWLFSASALTVCLSPFILIRTRLCVFWALS